MFLLLWSFLLGAIGFFIGMPLHSEAVAIFLGLVGFLSPSVVVLDRIHAKMKSKEDL